MNLDIEFVIYSSIIIACLIPLYVYRKKVFKFIYKTGDISLFVNDLKIHMQKEHPKIKFDYSIIDKTKNEKDIRIRETLIVEDIINQFFSYEYTKKTQSDIDREKHWPGYVEKSKTNDKYPNDWPLRKSFVFKRDNGRCNRCGHQLSIDNMITSFVKDIQNGGGYNFENIVSLCSDCNRILNSKDPKSTIRSLNINEKLMIFVQS